MRDSARARQDVRSVRLVRPFRCEMWPGHYRLRDFITEESCEEEIASFLKDGQKQPVLGRPVRNSAEVDVELIYGARRLFTAQHLNLDLLVEVRDITDREAAIEMDLENRLRKEISPYEQGIAFAKWLRAGLFESQKDIAKGLGMSEAQVSRLMKFAELPAAIVGAFPNQTDIRETWAVALAQKCEDVNVRNKILSAARSLQRDSADREPVKIFRQLLDSSDRRERPVPIHRDLIVRSDAGEQLFRISYRNADVHIVVPRERAARQTMEKLTEVLRQFFRDECAEEPTVHVKPRATLLQPAMRSVTLPIANISGA